jgi:hypothetical protein
MVAAHRRAERGVALHLARASERGLGLRQVGHGEIALRDGGAMRRVRSVEPLTGNRAALEEHLRAIVFGHRVGQPGLGGVDRRLGDSDRRDTGVDLCVHLGAVDRGHDLSLADAIANVDQHAFEASGELRLDAHAALRGERARDLERGLDGAGGCTDDRDVHERSQRRRGRRFRCG